MKAFVEDNNLTNGRNTMKKSCLICGAEFTPKNAQAARRQKFCSDRCRRAQYSRPCVDCGKPLSGSDGRGPNAPTRCPQCVGKANTIWTSETVVAAIQRFAERHGRPPVCTDFNPSLATSLGLRDRAERYRADGDYPPYASVQRVFGQWNNAIRAAGFEPLSTGRKLADRERAAA